MKKLKLTIEINKTPEEIFTFLLNPENTPKWIPILVKEEASEQPTKLGTTYRNTTDLKQWNTYTVTEFDQNKLFTFTSENKNYHCKYTLTLINEHTTQLEYYEWVDVGELEDPFSQEFLNNLKTLLEGK